jgi:hypothetical protein
MLGLDAANRETAPAVEQARHPDRQRTTLGQIR